MSKSRDLISAATLQNLEIFRLALRQDLKEELRKEVQAEVNPSEAELRDAWNSGYASGNRDAKSITVGALSCVLGLLNRGRITKKEAIRRLLEISDHTNGTIGDLVDASPQYVSSVRNNHK